MDNRLQDDYRSGNERFDEIIDFYLFKTPVPKTSRRGKTFGELKWQGSNFNTLLAAMRTHSSLGDFWICDKREALDAHIQRFHIDPSKPRECAIYAKGGSVKNDSKTKALFYGIRNAFAHGSFRTFEERGIRWYELESKDYEQLKGKFLLKESTLLAWKDDVLKGPRMLKKQQSRRGHKR